MCVLHLFQALLMELQGFLPSSQRSQVGQPLSPFLFVYVGEAHSHMIKGCGEAKLICYFKPASDAPRINHIQFADGTFIFCYVNEDQVMNAKATLLCFQAVSQA